MCTDGSDEDEEEAHMATNWVHRRVLLKWFGGGSAALVLVRVTPAGAQVSSQAADPLPAFTGPEANPYWNGVNPFVTYPQKLPLLRLTDRSIQLETPRQHFDRVFTPNSAFYVRYHLELIPNSVDLGTWRLQLEGNFDKPMQLSFEDLVRNFPAVSIAAVNECSGNSRSRFQPRVSGGQWGNGAMGNALSTRARLADLLRNAGATSGAAPFQLQG